MTVPRNVWWFEVLLYASLMLDALSVAFQDRTPTAAMTAPMINVQTVLALGLLLLIFWFIRLAAHGKKSWPRFALLAALAFSMISVAQVIGERGIELDVFIEIVSEALTACGLYLSFTGDAKDWFDA